MKAYPLLGLDAGQALLIVLLLSALTVPCIVPAFGLDDSTITITVNGDKFHVDIDLVIQLSISDYAQFVNAEDANSRDAGEFRGELREVIEDAIQELSPDATVTGIDVERVECDEDAGKMHVELSFDVEGAITTLSNGSKEYDLKWRSFKADKKFSVEGRGVDASEALGLDFRGWDSALTDDDDWEETESSGKTVFTYEREYVIVAEDGEVDLRTKMTIKIPGTGLTVSDEKAATAPTTLSTTPAESEPLGTIAYNWLVKWWWEPIRDFFGLSVVRL